jgi:dethiobiotin synthetase
MHLEINNVKVFDNGKVVMHLEYDESFQNIIAKQLNKKHITKREVHHFILNKLEKMLEEDITLVERLGGLSSESA